MHVHYNKFMSLVCCEIQKDLAKAEAQSILSEVVWHECNRCSFICKSPALQL